jgi:wobble nucleotide-excising tRNase
MIEKINTIEKLGIFENYNVDSNLEKFARFNLIYGWNGSGKTTFSELFKAFKDGKLDEFPDLKYTITCNNEKYSNARVYGKNIHVFNHKYIADNVDVVSGDIKPIFMLGKVKLDLSKIIKQDEKELSKREKVLEIKKSELNNKEKYKNNFFTSVAKIIKANILAKNYNKNNAEKAFNELINKEILLEKSVQEHLTTLKQQEKQQLEFIEITTIKELEVIINDSKNILNKTVETVVIDRLKNNPNISKWVEEGVILHQKTDLNNCEFCNQLLPDDRITQLLSYFNDADKLLKIDIENLLERIEIIYNSINNLSFMEEINLYDELQEGYKKEIESLEVYKAKLLNKIKGLIKEIENKRQHTTEVLILKTKINYEQFSQSIIKTNTFIEECNQKTENFSNAKNNAKLKLEKHYLSEILDDVDSTNNEINLLKSDCNKNRDGRADNSNNPYNLSLIEIQNRITKNKQEISTSGTACEEINKQLKTFLGRSELIFEVVENGYKIKRNGKVASRLSEGEKMAIAFVYFTIYLKDEEFNIKKDIVVIDDPISSMDTNSIFGAFSFLKNSVKDAHQVFILTHNFDFLQLVLGWMKHNKGHCFMIKNLYEGEKRIAILDKLDNLLKNYDTEYQYLFKLLTTFKTDGTIKSVYHIPNIARKTLESFLMFMIPNNKSMYQKLEAINFDENKKTSIYKFTNNQSHKTGAGFNPSIVEECKKNVQYLLEMIEETFPNHYKILKDSC